MGSAVTPAEAGVHAAGTAVAGVHGDVVAWIPAFAGMTEGDAAAGRHTLAYSTGVPQLPQNLDPGVSGVLHFAQVPAASEAPQLPQNFAAEETWLWHLGQVIPAGAGLPQLPQNLEPAGI